jgi:hypothetical protein
VPALQVLQWPPLEPLPLPLPPALPEAPRSKCADSGQYALLCTMDHVRIQFASEGGTMSGQIDQLQTIERDAIVQADAYRLRLLGRLWWANIGFVVLPAVFATLSAILAAHPASVQVPHHVATESAASATLVQTSFWSWIANLPWAALLAGSAAVLATVHKALKCDDYQAECLRVAQCYRSIAASAHFARLNGVTTESHLWKDITRRIEEVAANSRALLPDTYVRKAMELHPDWFSITPPRTSE